MDHRTDRIGRGGALLVAAGAALWGTDAVLRLPVLDAGMHPTAIVLAEHVYLLLFSIPVVALFWRHFAALRASQWIALVLIAWGGSGLATVLFTAAFATGDPTTVILLQKTQPLFAITLARLMLREPLGRSYWLFCLLAMAGAYLITFPQPLDPLMNLGNAQATAAALAIGAALLWGGATVFGRFVLAELPFTAVTGARFLLAVPFLLGLALVQGTAGQTPSGLVAATTASYLFLMALGPGLVSLLLYYRGLTTTRASVATLAELAFPATAVILNWVFLNNEPRPVQLIGFAVLWAAIVGLDRVNASHAPAPAARPAVATE